MGSDVRETDDTSGADDTFDMRAEVLKVDARLGLVMGWGMVCGDVTSNTGYIDVQDDHIPEESMLAAALDFAKTARLAVDDHARDANGSPVDAGTVAFMWPMTTDIAQAFGINSPTSGLMVAVRPSPGMLAKFESGEYSGFSIGGAYVRDEYIEVGEDEAIPLAGGA